MSCLQKILPWRVLDVPFLFFSSRIAFFLGEVFLNWHQNCPQFRTLRPAFCRFTWKTSVHSLNWFVPHFKRLSSGRCGSVFLVLSIMESHLRQACVLEAPLVLRFPHWIFIPWFRSYFWLHKVPYTVIKKWLSHSLTQPLPLSLPWYCRAFMQFDKSSFMKLKLAKPCSSQKKNRKTDGAQRWKTPDIVFSQSSADDDNNDGNIHRRSPLLPYYAWSFWGQASSTPVQGMYLWTNDCSRAFVIVKKTPLCGLVFCYASSNLPSTFPLISW